MLFMHTNIYRNGSLFSNKLFSEIFSCVCKIEESISFVTFLKILNISHPDHHFSLE